MYLKINFLFIEFDMYNYLFIKFDMYNYLFIKFDMYVEQQRSH
jgi:hypothetical protein